MPASRDPTLFQRTWRPHYINVRWVEKIEFPFADSFSFFPKGKTFHSWQKLCPARAVQQIQKSDFASPATLPWFTLTLGLLRSNLRNALLLHEFVAYLSFSGGGTTGFPQSPSWERRMSLMRFSGELGAARPLKALYRLFLLFLTHAPLDTLVPVPFPGFSLPASRNDYKTIRLLDFLLVPFFLESHQPYSHPGPPPFTPRPSTTNL